MNTLLARARTALGLGIAAALLAGRAQAACGVDDWNGASGTNWAQVTATALARVKAAATTEGVPSGPDANAGIVGLWSVTFTAEGNPGGPPDDTVIDAGYATWHADRTELMNSGKPPITGDFCMGVWALIAPATYKLNHFALGWHPDPSNPNLSVFDGPVNIQETVKLAPSGDSYKGKFTIDQYDPDGNLIGHVQGRVDATRITVGG